MVPLSLLFTRLSNPCSLSLPHVRCSSPLTSLMALRWHWVHCWLTFNVSSTHLEFHEISVSPFLKLFEVPLDGSTAIQHISHSFQFCIIYKLDEDTDAHQYRLQCQSMGYITSASPLAGLRAAEPWISAGFQSTSLSTYLAHTSSICQDVLGDGVRRLGEVKINNIYHSLLILCASYLILEGYQFGSAWFFPS